MYIEKPQNEISNPILNIRLKYSIINIIQKIHNTNTTRLMVAHNICIIVLFFIECTNIRWI